MPGKVKQRSDRARYIAVLRAMTPEQRLAKAFELSDMTHDALRVGLAARYPSADESELRTLYIQRLERCRKRSS